MTYKELLKFCNDNPGCFQTEEQRKAVSDMRYQIWLDQTNDDYLKEKIIKNQ